MAHTHDFPQQDGSILRFTHRSTECPQPAWLPEVGEFAVSEAGDYIVRAIISRANKAIDESGPGAAACRIEYPYDVGDGPQSSTSDIGGIRFEVRAGGEGFSDPTITFVP